MPYLLLPLTNCLDFNIFRFQTLNTQPLLLKALLFVFFPLAVEIIAKFGLKE